MVFFISVYTSSISVPVSEHIHISPIKLCYLLRKEGPLKITRNRQTLSDYTTEIIEVLFSVYEGSYFFTNDSKCKVCYSIL